MSLPYWFHRNLIVAAALALGACALVPAAQAQTTQQLDKHARKIERHLDKYPKGTFIDVALRDGSNTYGSLGELAATSFQFTESDTNKVLSFSYSDVESVKRAKEYIGSGSEPHHHLHLMLPVVIASGLLAAGAATYLAIR